MSRTKHFPRAVAWKRLKVRGAGTAVVLATILASVTVAGAAIMLFAVFVDDTGTVLTQSSDPTTLNSSNAFFDASIGMNGQACVTCHQPSIGITISTDFINKAFTKSGGTDPLFRPNDTANNPFGTITTDNPDNYSLIKTLGVVRIGKTLPTGANAPDFMIVAANAVTNEIFAAPETFPLTGDPQHLGMPTLSVFRRPLVNTNVNFDSSVLWDGRADISNMRAQVNGAIQTLLLGNGGDNEINDEIAAFMTGVYTDQKSSNVAGQLDAAGATGGVLNLLALSQSASRPCVFDEGDPGDATPDLTPFVAAVATPTSCTPVKPGAQPGGVFTLFDAWASLPNNPGNAGRLSVARGQAVFNTARGLDDEDNVIGCVFCHTVPNLGNNASAGADGFKRIGTESPSIMQTVLATAKADGNAAEIQMVQEMIDRNNQLPMYCLRPKSDMMGGACGTHPTDVVTTDPGRALVTGHIADVGMFKPPILRNLAVRSPYFHAGAAPSIDHLINFYNLRFGFGLNADEQTDLANFIDTGL